MSLGAVIVKLHVIFNFQVLLQKLLYGVQYSYHHIAFHEYVNCFHIITSVGDVSDIVFCITGTTGFGNTTGFGTGCITGSGHSTIYEALQVAVFHTLFVTSTLHVVSCAIDVFIDHDQFDPQFELQHFVLSTIACHFGAHHIFVIITFVDVNVHVIFHHTTTHDGVYDNLHVGHGISTGSCTKANV